MNWRTKTEALLEKLGKKITLHPKKIILFMLLASFAIISNIPKITIDTSTEGFLHHEDPALVKYEAFKEQFGQDERIMVVVRTKDIFDIKFLERFKELHVELQNNIPHLTDINSLINARNTRGDGDRLIVEDLVENMPQNAQELALLKRLATTSVMYKNLLLNSDNTLATIILEPNAYEGSSNLNALEGFSESKTKQEKPEFISDKSKSEMVRAAKAIAEKFTGDNFDVFIAGSLAVNDNTKKSMQSDMQKFIKLVLLIIAIFLFVVFRRVSGVLLPLFIVLVSLLSTVGLMAMTGTPISVPTQILPSFLLAVSIGATVHLLAMFFKHFNSSESKNEAVIFALGHSGLPIIMTSLTTAAGLLSFSSAEIAPIADLGIFGAVGIMLALVNTIVLLPAMLVALPIKKAKETHKNNSAKMDKILIAIANFSIYHAKKIVAVTAIVFVVFLYSASQLELKHDPLSWQKKDAPIRIATEVVDSKLKGSVTMEVILDTKKENGLHNSELLKKIDRVREKAEAISNDKYFVGKGWSVAEVLKEIHRALHANNEEYYAITDNNALIPQEFLLFENSGSDDLEDLVDSSFSKARLTFKLPWMEASEYEALSRELTTLIKDELKDEVEITITGMVPLFQRTLVAAMDTMAVSYATAFVLITIMMILLLGSLKIGMVSMLPNVLPVVMALGFMNMVGMPLDMFTMLIGAIIIGLSVDDTVHFFHNYAKYHHKGASVQKAVDETMLGTGRAMVATTIVLSLGFYVYMFASLSNLVNFGILTGGAIGIALLADIILAPALLKLMSKDEK
ncbi:efflux RND transporter permease subunit [Candidatus Sulfurimonas baltica]|uniref:MMPL family transporter n=1 Tax=Candidatus Sulfurimonas baltica TaxID=2740404 RepID=A0A7S7RNJ3_9BACT|nr:MMPL family transporter [Candidatus Sulfurimonas baltica]QOY53337.1 MMPL family transporter [Candidatus Sulfurimonas baltica]